MLQLIQICWVPRLGLACQHVNRQDGALKILTYNLDLLRFRDAFTIHLPLAGSKPSVKVDNLHRVNHLGLFVGVTVKRFKRTHDIFCRQQRLFVSLCPNRLGG